MGRHSAVHKHFELAYHVSGGALLCLLALLAYFPLPLPRCRPQSIASNRAPIGLIGINLSCLSNPKAPPQPCHEPADCLVCQEDQDSPELIVMPPVMGPVFPVFIEPVFTAGSGLKITRGNLPVPGERAVRHTPSNPSPSANRFTRHHPQQSRGIRPKGYRSCGASGN